MALCTVSNTGDALQKPDGTIASNTVIKFRLVSGSDLSGIEGWTTAGEITKEIVTTTTDDHGIFSVSLWPTTLMAGDVQYLVTSHGNLFRAFCCSLPNVATYSFSALRASQIPLSQAQLSALHIHEETVGLHLPLPVGADGAFVKVVAGVPAYVAVAPGMGDMTAAVYDTNEDGVVNAADYAATAPWSGISGKPTIPEAYNLPTASSSVLGGIKIGSGLSIDGSGTVTSASSYSLPTASVSTLGGVKIGSGISIDGNGAISAAGGGGGAGDVTGPASAIDSNFAAFNSTTGKLIKDSGKKASDFEAAGAAAAITLAGLGGITSASAVAPNAAITPSTKTKITYDAKGLVTAGADATAADVGAAATGSIGSSGLTMATGKLLGRGTAATGSVEEITLGTNLSLSGTTLNAAGGSAGSTIQALGTKDTNYTVDFNSGLFATATTGTGAATLTIPDYASSTVSVTAWLYITQGSTARTQTLGTASGTNNNVVSSGGLMGAGDALPNSGASKVDAYQFTWTGTKWMTTNAIFDVAV